MARYISLLILIPILMCLESTAQKSVITISWKKVTVVPPSGENQRSLGLAGVINGVSNDVLIVAGGSNFPDKLPWEGGKKVYYDNIFVLEKKENQYCWNKNIKLVLPAPVAYCGITSTPSGIACIGGENANGISDKCFLMKWNEKENNVEVKALPNLPLALTNMAVTNIDDVVYAAGGDEKNKSSNSFFCLDLKDKNFQWKRLPGLPIALANATAIAQNSKSGESIFIIGGRSKTLSGISDLHNTVFAFDIVKNEWKRCADISDGVHTINLSAASGVALGDDEILITGFDNGKTFHKIETLIAKITLAETEQERQQLTEEKNNLSIHHKGFDKSLLLYNTNGNAWTKIGELPFSAHVTTTDVKWGNDIVISNGEIRPGIRTPDVMIGKVIRSYK
jgi:cyclically-permuted mutarotase family protein